MKRRERAQPERQTTLRRRVSLAVSRGSALRARARRFERRDGGDAVRRARRAKRPDMPCFGRPRSNGRAGSNRRHRVRFFHVARSIGCTRRRAQPYTCSGNLNATYHGSSPPLNTLCAVTCVIPGPSDVACDLGRATDRAVRAAQRLRPQRHHLEGTKRPLPHAPPQP